MGGTRLQGFGSPTQGLAHLMAFIDGGYLREQFKQKFGSDSINYGILKHQLVENFNANCDGKYRGDISRVYYYDGIVEPSNSKYKKQMEYFDEIRNINGYQVRLGRLRPSGKEGKGPLKQKGVDVLLAVDMISKAHQDHYDFAIMIAGDDDFLDVVDAVKDAGKRVFGVYFPERISKELFDSWDARIKITNFLDLIR